MKTIFLLASAYLFAPIVWLTKNNVILCKKLWRWSHNLHLPHPVLISTVTNRLICKSHLVISCHDNVQFLLHNLSILQCKTFTKMCNCYTDALTAMFFCYKLGRCWVDFIHDLIYIALYSFTCPAIIVTQSNNHLSSYITFSN